MFELFFCFSHFSARSVAWNASVQSLTVSLVLPVTTSILNISSYLLSPKIRILNFVNKLLSKPYKYLFICQTAHDIMRQLAPIFEQIRRQRDMPYAYPLSVAGRKSLVRPSYYLVNLIANPFNHYQRAHKN